MLLDSVILEFRKTRASKNKTLESVSLLEIWSMYVFASASFPKLSLFLILLVVALLAFWVLPRLGVNPLLLIQKIFPLLSSIRNFIPF